MRLIRVTLDTPVRRNSRKNLGTNGHWLFEEPLGAKGEFGFIYLIHDTLHGMMYIGKKQFVGAGKLNKGKDSDWKTYTSSCTALQKSMQDCGIEHFKFHVLEQYKIRGSLGYAETWSLMHVEALAHRDKWYNGLVNKVSWNVKQPVTQRHKERLSAIMAGKEVAILKEDT